MSTELKHTPGPWHLRMDNFFVNKCTITISDKEDWRFGSIWIADVKGTHVGPENAEETIANAKLIAAAPELLDACIEALRYHQGGHSEIGFKLREVIKKATPDIKKSEDGTCGILPCKCCDLYLECFGYDNKK